MQTASGKAPAAQPRLQVGAEDVLLARRALVATLYRDGLTQRQIAARLCISQSAVQRDLIAAGEPRRRTGPQVSELERRRIAKRREEVAGRYLAGETMQQLADALGVSLYTLWCDLRATGVERRRSGPRAKYPKPSERPCVYCGRRFTPTGKQVADGYGETCSHRCKTLNRWWRTGNGISEVMLANAQARANDRLFARRMKGRWAGRKGGRPRDEVTPEQLAEIRRWRNVGYGRRKIAEMLRQRDADSPVTEDIVRRVLAELAPADEQLTL